MAIGQVIAVGSGKGGVGKSSVVVGVAHALAASGKRVGILDADLYGPDIPLMLGVTRTTPATHIDVWRNPAFPGPKTKPLRLDGLSVMSIQLLMSESQAFATAGPLASMFIGRLCNDIDWGDIDYLIVDLPPGTGDIAQAVVGALRVSAALVVVTPQAAAHLDTRKLLTFFGQHHVRVVGAVENMTGAMCPECGHEFQLFAPAAEHRTIWDDGVSRLISMPFDAAAASDGWPGRTGPAADRFRALAERLVTDLPHKS